MSSNSTTVGDSEVLYTLRLYGTFCLVTFILYCIIRPRIPKVYSPRNNVVADTFPPLKKGLLSWIPQLIFFDDKKILETVGLDAYQYIRLVKLCLKFCAICAPLSIVALGSTYAVIGTAGVNAVEKLSLTHVQPTDKNSHICYWMGWAFTYLVTSIGLWLLSIEYEHYMDTRQHVLSQFAPRTYTVLVEQIPNTLNDKDLLMRYFDSIFPGKVVEVNLVPTDSSVAELDSLMEERRQVILKLDRANFDEKTAQNSSHDINQSLLHLEFESGSNLACGCSNCISLNSRICCYGKLPQICGFKASKVNSASFYADELERLNKTILEKQKEFKSCATDQSTTHAFDDNDSTHSKLIENFEDLTTEEEQVMWLLGDFHESPGKMVASAAFVTFNTLLPRTIVAQCSLDNYSKMVTMPAPDVPDIVWQNLGMSHRRKFWSKLGVYSVNIVLLFLYGILTSLISASTNLESIRVKWKELDEFLTENPSLSPILEQIAPLLLLILFSLVTPILWNILRLTMPRSWSELDRLFFYNYYIFVVVQTFLFFQISDTLFSLVGTLIEDPREFVLLLARTIPSNSSFFLQYILIRFFCILPLELLRMADVTIATVVRPLFCGFSKSPKERLNAPCGCHTIDHPGEAWHAKNSVSDLLILTMGITYSVMAPLILLVGGLFAAGSLFTYRHQLQYVYVNSFESRGSLWPSIFWCVCFAFLLMQITMLGVFALAEQPIQSVLMVPLMFATGLFAYNAHKKYKKVALHLPLRHAAYWDFKGKQQDKSKTVLPGDYIYPALQELTTERTETGVYQSSLQTNEKKVIPSPSNKKDSFNLKQT